MLFTRDLRIHDHPALAEACDKARRVVPLFVLDPSVPAGRRTAFLHGCLHDLRDSLRSRGGDLFLRRGDVVAETMKLAREVAAEAVWASADVSSYARRRERRLAAECAGARLDFRCFPGLTVVPPGGLLPTGGDHYRVFTPYWRAWTAAGRRAVREAPGRVPTGEGPAAGSIPAVKAQPGAFPPGESAARDRMAEWSRHGVTGYDEGHDDLAGDRTSRLSPYLRFGCLSPLELAGWAAQEGFVRQLCWRDFYHQVTYAFPEINRRDYRPGRGRWRDDGEAAEAWRAGMTGVPIVDAGMRQLRAEGWMHNRARLITASFLVKHLGIDWRMGADHFFELLLDGDVADNSGNWQWVAGTGNDTRPYRSFNPLRQAVRFDPDGDYVRRHVPELAGVAGRAVHEPWGLPAPVPGYPAPIIRNDVPKIPM